VCTADYVFDRAFYEVNDFQPRAALNPSQASTAATTQTTQLAHNGIEWVAPMVMAQPLTARTNCSKATMVKMIAAKRE
jgi:hypothetical protein